MKLPLDGIRVLDLSWIIAGPTATRLLAIMGAEVVKVGSSRRPDPSHSGPAFHSYNQSKQYASINIASEQGVEIVRELVSLSDVVIENFATGVIERWGLGYQEVRSSNPSIIMISASGVGHTGPKKDHVAYGSLLQHYTGWNSQSGYPGGPPIKGGLWADPWVGMELAMVIAACINYRASSGEGQYVDFSMAEALVGSMPMSVIHQQITGEPLLPQGNEDDFDLLSGVYPCEGDDRWVSLSIQSLEQWRSLCDRVGALEFKHENPKNILSKRGTNKFVSNWSKQRSDLKATDALQSLGIPSAPSWNIYHVYQDDFLKDRNYFVETETNDGKTRFMPGVPWWFDDGLNPNVKAAPKLGQDNRLIFGDLLGIGDKEYLGLVKSKVLE